MKNQDTTSEIQLFGALPAGGVSGCILSAILLFPSSRAAGGGFAVQERSHWTSSRCSSSTLVSVNEYISQLTHISANRQYVGITEIAECAQQILLSVESVSVKLSLFPVHVACCDRRVSPSNTSYQFTDASTTNVCQPLHYQKCTSSTLITHRSTFIH